MQFNYMNNNTIENSNTFIDIIEIQKMIFIYNAILSGWTVNKNTNNNFEFVKKGEETNKEVNLNNYLNNFINHNLNINNIK